MTDSGFPSMVAEAAALESDEEAERVAVATLAELGRNVSPGEAEALAGRLPGRYGRALVEADQHDERPEPFEQFLEHVAARGDVEEDDVRATIRGVMGAVAEYVGTEEVTDAAAQLPPEYGAVMEPAGVSADETFTESLVASSSLDAEVAAVAAEAVLGTLGERLSREEAEDVAAYLHGDADEWLVEEHSGDAQDVPADEFVERVAARAEVFEERAREYVAEVSGVLRDEAPTRELEDAVDQLPEEYGELLAAN